MPVIGTVELLNPGSGDETREGRNYTARYMVTSTSIDPNTIMQAQADGLPGFADIWPTDGFSHVVKLTVLPNPERLNDGGTTKYQWLVDVHYAPRTSNVVPKADPTDEKPEVNLGSVIRETVLDRDINDDAVINSASDPFDPPIMESKYDDLLTVTVNIAKASFGMFATMAYKGTYNSDAITICNYAIPKYAGLMRDIRAVATSRNGTDYWAVSYEIQITRRPGLWQYHETLDQGYQYINSDAKKTKILNSGDKEPVSEPALLDGKGGILASGKKAVYRNVAAKSGKAWSGLSLPTATF